jgi:hypothetical protein
MKSLKIDPEILASMIEAAKQLEANKILQHVETDDLKQLHYEIAEDIDIKEAIERYLN